jgi:hypothetical protein
VLLLVGWELFRLININVCKILVRQAQSRRRSRGGVRLILRLLMLVLKLMLLLLTAALTATFAGSVLTRWLC